MSMTRVDAMAGKRERGWPPWLLHESPSSSTLINVLVKMIWLEREYPSLTLINA